MILLKPVDDIMEKLGITPYTLGLSDDHDEFFRLNSALDSLTAQVSEVHSVLHEKEQLVRERLLLGILHASVDITALPQEYMKYGLVFPYRFFSLILIHMPALEIMEDFTKKRAAASRCPLQRFGGIFRPRQSLRHPYKWAEYRHLAQYLHRRSRANGRIKAPLQRYFPTHAADAFH